MPEKVVKLPTKAREYLVRVEFYMPIQAVSQIQAKRKAREVLAAHMEHVTCSEPEMEILDAQ